MIGETMLAVLIAFLICLQTGAVTRLGTGGYELAERTGSKISEEAAEQLAGIGECIICTAGTGEEEGL